MCCQLSRIAAKPFLLYEATSYSALHYAIQITSLIYTKIKGFELLKSQISWQSHMGLGPLWNVTFERMHQGISCQEATYSMKH